MTSANPLIFVSYRRTDSADIVGRILERLHGTFGNDRIFRDVDNIELGVDFRDRISEAVGATDLLLVVIGPDWLTATKADGSRRLDDPEDFVRLEVEAGLSRNIRVVPLFVRGATTPAASELPPSLQPLVMRNGLPIRQDPDFNNDMDRLLGAIDSPTAPRVMAVDTRARSSYLLIAAAVCVVVAAIAYLMLSGGDEGQSVAAGGPAEPEPSGVQATTVAATAAPLAPTTVVTEPAPPIVPTSAVITEPDPTAVPETNADEAPVLLSDEVLAAIAVPTFQIEALVWTTDSDPPGNVDWPNASAWCDQIAIDGLSFRLPAIAELESIAETRDPDDMQISAIFEELGGNWVWSSEPDGAGSAWYYDYRTLMMGSAPLNFDEGIQALCVSG